MVRGVQAVKARAVPDTTFFCLSNSNSVFIDVILKVRTSSDDRPEVTATDWVGHSTTRSNLNLSRSSPTPPSSSRMACCRSSDAWTPPGRSTAAGLAAAPTCARASDPLCSVLEADRRASSTGKELDEFMERHGGWATFDRVVYVGDGGNDFCPLLRLRPCVLSPLTELKLIRAQTRPCVGAVVPRALATDHQGGRVGGAQGVRPVLGRRVGGRADPPVERVAAVAWSCLPKLSNPTLVDSPRCNCSCRAAKLSCITVRGREPSTLVCKLEVGVPNAPPLFLSRPLPCRSAACPPWRCLRRPTRPPRPCHPRRRRRARRSHPLRKTRQPQPRSRRHVVRRLQRPGKSVRHTSPISASNFQFELSLPSACTVVNTSKVYTAVAVTCRAMRCVRAVVVKKEESPDSALTPLSPTPNPLYQPCPLPLRHPRRFPRRLRTRIAFRWYTKPHSGRPLRRTRTSRRPTRARGIRWGSGASSATTTRATAAICPCRSTPTSTSRWYVLLRSTCGVRTDETGHAA